MRELPEGWMYAEDVFDDEEDYNEFAERLKGVEAHPDQVYIDKDGRILVAHSVDEAKFHADMFIDNGCQTAIDYVLWRVTQA